MVFGKEQISMHPSSTFSNRKDTVTKQFLLDCLLSLSFGAWVEEWRASAGSLSKIVLDTFGIFATNLDVLGR